MIGLDSVDKDLVSKWISDGSLPNFKKLSETGAWGDVVNPLGLEAGSAWTSLYYGSEPAAHGQYDGIRRFDPQTYGHRRIADDELTSDPIWTRLSKEGKRCFLVDAPYIPLKQPFNGIAILDWTGHAPHNGRDVLEPVVSPPSFEQELLSKYGADPLGGLPCDHYRPRTLEEQAWFRDALINRIKMKTRLIKDLAERRDWDFFMAVYGECHCIGHHLWHVHDPHHPDHDPEIAAAIGNPMKQAYQGMDEAVGDILKDLDDDVTVIVHLSHGIGPGYSGTRMLDRILARLEGNNTAQSDNIKRRMLTMWRNTPSPIKKALSPLHGAYRKNVHNGGFLPNRAERKFFEVIVNDRTGGIRLNLAGREQNGVVDPSDYDAICAQLVEDLKAMVNVETGEPLAEDVIITRDHHCGAHSDDLADVLVIWNREKPIRIATSEKTGTVRHPAENSRSGDHLPFGRFYATGADIQPERLNHLTPVTDFAPTIATVLEADVSYRDTQLIRPLLHKAPAAAPREHAELSAPERV